MGQFYLPTSHAADGTWTTPELSYDDNFYSYGYTTAINNWIQFHFPPMMTSKLKISANNFTGSPPPLAIDAKMTFEVWDLAQGSWVSHSSLQGVDISISGYTEVPFPAEYHSISIRAAFDTLTVYGRISTMNLYGWLRKSFESIVEEISSLETKVTNVE